MWNGYFNASGIVKQDKLVQLLTFAQIRPQIDELVHGEVK